MNTKLMNYRLEEIDLIIEDKRNDAFRNIKKAKRKLEDIEQLLKEEKLDTISANEIVFIGRQLLINFYRIEALAQEKLRIKKYLE